MGSAIRLIRTQRIRNQYVNLFKTHYTREIVTVPLVKERPASQTLGLEDTQPGDQFPKMVR